MDMDFSLDLFIHALDKINEDKLWEWWKLQYPIMNKETYISWDDYKKQQTIKPKKHTKLSYEDIEREMAEIEQASRERERR